MALDQPKGWISLILGLVLLVLGVIPLLNRFGVIGFNVPFMTSIPILVLELIAAIAGLVLIIDAFMEMDTLRMVSLIVGVIILALSLIPALNAMGFIGFGIPFISLIIYQAIFLIEGIFLVIAAFAMW